MGGRCFNKLVFETRMHEAIYTGETLYRVWHKSVPWLKTSPTQKTRRSSQFFEVDLLFSIKKQLISKRPLRVYLFRGQDKWKDGLRVQLAPRFMTYPVSTLVKTKSESQKKEPVFCVGINRDWAVRSAKSPTNYRWTPVWFPTLVSPVLQ